MSMQPLDRDTDGAQGSVQSPIPAGANWAQAARAVHFSGIALAAALVTATPAFAGPEGSNVVGGNATIAGQGGATVTVTQSTDRAIINWNTFNIGAGETARFNQPSTSAVTLNRVTGGQGPSQIYGTITANGRVFLINRDGILFGPSAVVDTSGFLATTHDIKNDDFMAGRYVFGIPGRDDASIVNQGTITAHNAGFAALVSPGVRNSGTITANLGTVALASGNGFTLDFYGDRLITLGVSDSIAANIRDVATGQPLTALVRNDGRLRVNGGRVELSAVTARRVVDSVINNTGVIEANSFHQRGGTIVLSAGTGAVRPAGAKAQVYKQTVRLAGTLSASAKKRGKGGTVVVTGENIEVVGARIDVSGPAGGGTVMIGGDWSGGHPDTSLISNPSARLASYAVPTATTVTVDGTTVIDASATRAGNGGKVVVWADGTNTFAGTILARGGSISGDGGFVETSGHQTLNYTGSVDTRAPHGATGTLLLDPNDVYIDSTFITRPPQSSVIMTNDLQNQLATSNVVITTNNAISPIGQNGDIFVNGSIAWNSSNSLTLNAFRNIQISDNVTISNTGAGSLTLRADSTGTGAGTVAFNQATSGSRINFTGSTGRVSIFYNPVGGYTAPTNFTPAGQGGGTRGVTTNGAIPNQFTAYMLVNTATNLQAVSTNLGGTYALGRDIDASTNPNAFVPIGSPSAGFTGLFDGQGRTIANLTISSSSQYVGLFGNIGTGGAVRNLILTNASVTTTGASQFVGGLAGRNAGSIVNVEVTGFVGSPLNAAPPAPVAGAYGGLVGLNDTGGSISNAHSAAAVSAIGPTSNGYVDAGGLVGQNHGTITQSDASGAISGTYASPSTTYFGGLVGWNLGGTITLSHATGSVTGSGSFGYLGGLTGVNDGQITQSWASGAVTSSGPASFAGGFVGANDGTIGASFATGPVTSGNGSVSGGFAGANGGTITQSYATSPVTGGANSRIGGFVGDNTGTIDQAYGVGALAGGSGATIGGFAPSGGGTGTITNSYWDIQGTGAATSNGGTGLTTAQFTSSLPAGFDPAVWTIKAGQTYPYLINPAPDPLPMPRDIPGSNQPDSPQVQPESPQFRPDTQVFQTTPTQQIADLWRNADPTPTVQAALVTPAPPRRPQRPNAPPASRQFNDRLVSGVPPPGETRFIQDQVVFQVGGDVPAARIAMIARRLGLVPISSQNLGLIDRTVYQFRITNGQSVADVIRRLEALRVIAAAQPNYLFELAQVPPAPAPPPAAAEGDPAQYIIAKLRLPELHRLGRGTNVRVAVIDSEIDRNHPDLEGVIAERFSAAGADDKPHPHGTGMAGAIASHKRLIGVAPGARLLAVHAFGPVASGGQGTSMQIVKGLDWAVSQKARVINMSFAGPKDPLLAQAVKVVHDQGVVLIAAAGNAGPTSPPLFPGADPNVIAVTATDADDHSYTGANRGRYVAVAAPGVDILVPAPDGGYQLTTGTSVAAAHVSGIAALLLEKDPKLSPDEIRSILTSTAKTLGTRTRDDEFGYGLVDPIKALNSVNPRASSLEPAPAALTAAAR